jgi:tetratricopeptide (TPR) repeat protein
MNKKFIVARKLFNSSLFWVCLFFIFFLFSFAAQGGNEEYSSFEKDSLLSIEMNKKGTQHLRIGDFDNAVVFLKKAVELDIKLYGEKSMRLTTPLINLGIIFKNLGEYDKAIETYLEAEKVIKEMDTSDNPRLGYVYANLGTVYKLKGDINRLLCGYFLIIRESMLMP